MRALAAFLLTTSALLAGCADEAPTDDVTVAPVLPVAERSWVNDTFSGAFVGVDGVLVRVNAGGLVGQETVHPFEMPEGTASMVLRFQGAAALPTTEAHVILTPAGCDFGGSCESDVVTSGLRAEFGQEAPAAGTWHLRAFLASPGAERVEFDVEVDREILTFSCPQATGGEEARDGEAGDEGGDEAGDGDAGTGRGKAAADAADGEAATGGAEASAGCAQTMTATATAAPAA